MTDRSSQEGLATVAPCTRARPRLAVLIPVFNDHEGLKRSLASLAQENTRFDVFVVDDGSQPPIAIPSDLPYKVHLLRQEPNRGITAALNAGLAQIAQGGYQYVARLDACDLSLPGRFAAQLAFLDSHPEHAVVGTATRRVDTQGNLLFLTRSPREHDSIMRFLRYRACITHASAMMRMQALRTVGFYREQFPGGEDYDLFLRIGKSYKLACLDQVFLVVEVSKHSITSNRQKLLIRRIGILKEHFAPWSVHAYLGIAANVLFLMAPRPLVLKLRQLYSQWRERMVGAR